MPETTETTRYTLSWHFWAALVLIAAAVAVIVQNTGETSFVFFWLTVTAPLWLLLSVTLALGVLIGWLVAWRRALR